MRPAVRLFVWGFLAAFAVCTLAGFNLWPLTDWRLFSHVRSERVRGWQVTTVDAGGAEERVPLERLAARYRGWSQVAAGLRDLPPEKRDDVCRAWASAGGVVEVVEVRVYATEEWLARPGSWRRELRFVCPVPR